MSERPSQFNPEQEPQLPFQWNLETRTLITPNEVSISFGEKQAIAVHLLIKNIGEIVTNEQFFETVYGNEGDIRKITTLMNSIMAKFSGPSFDGVARVINERGKGYRLKLLEPLF